MVPPAGGPRPDGLPRNSPGTAGEGRGPGPQRGGPGAGRRPGGGKRVSLSRKGCSPEKGFDVLRTASQHRTARLCAEVIAGATRIREGPRETSVELAGQRVRTEQLGMGSCPPGDSREAGDTVCVRSVPVRQPSRFPRFGTFHWTRNSIECSFLGSSTRPLSAVDAHVLRRAACHSIGPGESSWQEPTKRRRWTPRSRRSSGNSARVR